MNEEQKKDSASLWPVYLAVFAAVVALAGWGVLNVYRTMDGAEESVPLDWQAQTHVLEPKPTVRVDETPKIDAKPFPPAEHTHTAEKANGTVERIPTLRDIAYYRRTWDPVMTNWYGKEPEDFTFSDITGEKHKLSDYKGKDVIVTLWATWCPPCIKEIPHFKELRDKTSRDELAILAISNEDIDTVKRFSNANRLNYTVISMRKRLPVPFGYARSTPTNFYIDKQWKVKLVTEGLVSGPETEAILNAKE